MTMYHVNDNKEVKRCSAQSRDACRFKNGHYHDWGQAQQQAETLLDQQFPDFPQQHKHHTVQRSVQPLTKRGVHIQATSAHHMTPNPEYDTSTVDILSDSPDDDARLLQSFRQGDIQPFR